MAILHDDSLILCYKLNITKTQVIRQKYKLKWKAKSIKYPGVLITKELNKIYETNYNIRNNRIQRDITKWSTLVLDLSSRIEVVKMNVLLRLLYRFLSLPVRISVNRKISRFISAGARPRVKFKTSNRQGIRRPSPAKSQRILLRYRNEIHCLLVLPGV